MKPSALSLSAKIALMVIGALAARPALAIEPTRFTVEVRGEGPDVILVPGLASSRAVWADTVARNKEHLKIMLAKDFWTTEDLKPLQDAAK